MLAAARRVVVLTIVVATALRMLTFGLAF